MVGRFIQQKDYETGLKALGYLYNELGIKNIEVNIAGYGILKDNIINWIDIYDIKPITKIFEKPKNLNELYTKATIYFSSSIFEGFSNTVMEAMSYKLPIVATNVGDNSKLIIQAQTGFLADNEYVAMANCLHKLCTDIELRERLGQNAYKHLLNNFSFKAFQQKYFKLINELCVSEGS
jgi:glycosyltransferase involved in cell wall biosynthesis